MQAHPPSTTAARILSLSHSPLADAFPANRLAANLSLPPTLLLPPPAATPQHSRSIAPPAYSPVAEQAGLAHDAGNLLGALHLYSDLLSAPGVLRPEHRHYAAELHLIAARSSALIQRLLIGAAAHHNGATPCQPDATRPEPAPPVKPATALRALAPVLERIAAGAARVTVAIPGALPPCELPAEALERITVNLVRNAAEAIRSSRQGDALALPGNVRVALEHAADAVRLIVEDDGPGMPPVVAAAFLRPGPRPAGTIRGLGHRIVHELATQTGAKLSIRVRPGRGTTFCLRWPLSEQDNDHTALEPPHRAAPSGTQNGGLQPC